MPNRHVLFVLMLLAVPAARFAGAAVTAGTAINVRVYNSAGVESAAVDAGLDVAAATLAAASVDVRWQRCGEDLRCQMVMRAPELALRFVRRAVGRHSTGAVPLGDALVDPRARTGVLATIYADRVERLAAASGAEMPTLLGRAIAHELGHLLLATSTHSSRGLMRAAWSLEDIRRRDNAAWAFTDPDVAAIRARLRGLPR
jgi:hypothetical protein